MTTLASSETTKKLTNAQRCREWRQKNPDKQHATNARWQKANPKMVWAHRKLNNALISGKIKRGPCDVCCSSKDIHAHHPDYDYPLEVRWMCRSHHRQLHTILKKDEKMVEEIVALQNKLLLFRVRNEPITEGLD